MAAHRIALALALTLLVPSAAAAGMPGLSAPGAPQTTPPPGGLLPPDLPPGGPEILCALRDEALDRTSDLFQKLGLNDLFKNYYCDGGCYMCCHIPGNDACHTSFDYDDEGNAPINCSPAVYGPGTTIVGEALVYGDSLGLGICIGGVQQACHHFPICSGAGAGSAPPQLMGASAGSASPPPELMGAGAGSGSPAPAAFASGESSSSSPPPHPDMTLPGAYGSRAKAFAKMMLQRFTAQTRERPAHLPHRDYVDFATARGAVSWRSAMANIEPYSGDYDVFRVEGALGELLPDESQRRGILYHANLGLLGAVPNVLERLSHVESRFWSAQELADYLGGIDAEEELRRTMGPIALEALKSVPIQDWRLLAVAAPGETSLPYRMYEGFELGQAPLVSAAQDCGSADALHLAVQIDDPQQAANPDTLYPVVVSWGDGSFSEHEYDSRHASNVFSHAYAEPGTYLAYVTASNGSGLRGIAGLVVEALASGGPAPAPSIARVELDRMLAFAPALSIAGELSFELEGLHPDGRSTAIGWSEQVALPNAGSMPMGLVVGHHDTLTPLDAVVLRPKHSGGYRYDSVYFELPSLTLGFWDPELGAITTRTIPVTQDTLQVWYAGATQPVPGALLERNANGDLVFPVERGNQALPPGFCGGAECRLVERIEIPLTPELLAQRPASGPGVPADLDPGDLARWLEDVPNTFVAAPQTGPSAIAGTCAASLAIDVVPADEPVGSRVASLLLSGPAPFVSGEEPVDLRALAILTDGTQLDVTDRVTWSSSDPTVLRISNGPDKGRLTAGLIPGTSTLSAALGELSAGTAGTNGSADRGYPIYRVQIERIHGAIGRAGISSLELIADDRVLENGMSALDSGEIGPFAARVSSSPGSSALYAFDASLGTGWMSATGTFSTQAPYAAAAEPVWLQAEFDHAVPVQGIRLHRQPGILSVSFVPQFPKQIAVQGSYDGVVFHDLIIHVVENWDHQPLEIRWEGPDLDADHDGLPDSSDNCPAWSNPVQSDADANGIGDDCECGDQDGNGAVDVLDLVAIHRAIFVPALATTLCDANGDGSCDVQDLVSVNQRIFGGRAHCARNPAP
jgi:hypothetical protein